MCSTGHIPAGKQATPPNIDTKSFLGSSTAAVTYILEHVLNKPADRQPLRNYLIEPTATDVTVKQYRTKVAAYLSSPEFKQRWHTLASQVGQAVGSCVKWFHTAAAAASCTLMVVHPLVALSDLPTLVKASCSSHSFVVTVQQQPTRGIVIAAGGSYYLPQAIVLLRVLRHELHSSLPVELYWYGDQEMDDNNLQVIVPC